jgi:hypothetical protein
MAICTGIPGKNRMAAPTVPVNAVALQAAAQQDAQTPSQSSSPPCR